MKIFGLELEPLSQKQLLQTITQLHSSYSVFTPNPEMMLESLRDAKFYDRLQQADFLTSDGIGLYIAYQIIDNNFGKILNFLLLPYFVFNVIFRKKMLYKKYGERICGSDLTKKLVDFSQKNHIKICIIDLYNPDDEKKQASQKVFEKKLQEKFPNLDFDYYIYNVDKKEEIHQKIRDSKAKILFSTLGMKKQETSILEIMQTAKNIKIGLAVGSSFDYFVGFQKRAPKIWRKIGLERLYRLITGPQKIKRIKRLKNALVVFPIAVIMKK